MSAPSVADPSVAAAGTRPATRRRPRARLRAVPNPATPADPVHQSSHTGAAPAPLTVTISVDGGAPEARDRFLAALRDLVTTAGPDAVAVAATATAPAEPGIVHVDPGPRAAFRDGELLELSRLEYDLLLFFARHPHQVFTRGQLLSEVWGHAHTGARTVDVHISRLRQKLGGPELISTVYGVGYRLADAAPVRVVPPRAGGVSWTA